MSSLLKWQDTWKGIGGPPEFFHWSATWADSGVYVLDQNGVLGLTGTLALSAPSLNKGKLITLTKSLTLQGTLGVTGDIGLTAPPPDPYHFDPVGGIPISTINGVIGVSGQIRIGQPKNLQILAPLGIVGDLNTFATITYTDPGAVAKNIVQVGAIALNGATTVAGNIAAVATRKNITQIAPIGMFGVLAWSTILQIRAPYQFAPSTLGINGTLTVAGNIASPFPFGLAQTGAIGITGVVTTDAPDVHGAVGWDLVQAGSIDVTGVVTVAGDIASVAGEGSLPTGWYIERFLETVPNPNYGTPYGNAYFTRWTWRGFDDQGQQVAASGSEQDCFTQTLSIAQTRRCC